ncbi:MAG: hypothetical protein J2P57_02550 [Acidimicrobiaceae bacterium]|nr:hypothetical protein [Acidimicrobiaceae bacterium]
MRAANVGVPVLREYALLADGHRGILVGPRGEIAWMCAPRWEDDGVFSSLLGGRGLYSVCPDDPHFVWGGFYDEGTLIWNTRWVTSDTVVECREALAYPGQAETAVVLRQIRAVRGRSRVRVHLDARAGFGRAAMADLAKEQGIWTARTGGLHLRWSGASGARRRPDGGLEMTLTLEPSQAHDLVLEVATAPPEGEAPRPHGVWAVTDAAWHDAVPEMPDNVAPRDARHAYAVLRGLTSPSAGMVAAATMGLPERDEAGRNYDYRYAWIRDQCYAGEAMAVTRPLPLLDDALAFVTARLLEDGPKLKPAYRVDGGTVPDERKVPHLAGYPGGGVRVGNWVNHQFQLDAFGEALLLLGAAARHDRMNVEQWQAVEVAAAAVEARAQDPDAGLWELDDHHWTHSRLICAAGLRSVAAAAPPAQAASWSALADHMVAEVGAACVHQTGRWQRAPDDPRVDAALLLPAIRGAVAPDDPRSRATFETVETELSEDGYLYRFRQDERPLGEAEGAFLLCGFVMALAADQQGQQVKARAWFERNRAACGPPGLFTEEFDVAERQLRGNLPQAFVHAMLLECAQRL